MRMQQEGESERKMQRERRREKETVAVLAKSHHVIDSRPDTFE